MTINVGGINTGGNMDPETVGNMTKAAVVRAMREDGGFRGQHVRAYRRSLRG